MNELEISTIENVLKGEKWATPFYAIRVDSDIGSLVDQALWVWVVYDVEEVDLEAAHQAERKIQSLISEAGDDEDETAWPDDLNESPVVG